MWLRYIVVAAFVIHGLAHLSGFAATFTGRDAGFTSQPWIFSKGVTLRSPIGKLFGILWLIAAIVLVCSGIALVLRPSLWPILPIMGAILSLAAIIPWWRTVVPGAKAGAVFDGIVLAALVPPWSTKVMALLGV